jgi:hypothetical protein
MSESCESEQCAETEAEESFIPQGIDEHGDILCEYGVGEIQDDDVYLLRKGWVSKTVNEENKTIWHTRFPPDASYTKKKASGKTFLDPIKLKLITNSTAIPGTDWPIYTLRRCPEFYASKLANAMAPFVLRTT